MKPQTREKEKGVAESRIVIALMVTGDPEQVSHIKTQVERYAESLPGVQIDNK